MEFNRHQTCGVSCRTLRPPNFKAVTEVWKPPEPGWTECKSNRALEVPVEKGHKGEWKYKQA